MPTIIDSLFLELGIDTSKFSKDQQSALAKIAQFESQAKRSAANAAGAVKTVGAAFRDLTNDSRIGASAQHLDNFAKKLKALGQSAQVAGGLGTPLGALSEGLGMLLSPAALGIAAVGLLGKGMWDLNKDMTAVNATMYRQAQLSGMNASNLWAWGEAARAVGADPAEVSGGISGLQTSIMGMGIGAGNATSQLVALARLGVGFNFRTGANVPQLFARVHAMAAARNYQDLGALRALTGPVMNEAMWNIATDRAFDPTKLNKQIQGMEPRNLAAILQESLKSQEVLGQFGIRKDILAETAYGGTQGLMQAMVQLLTSILDVVNRILNFFVSPKKALGEAKDWLISNTSTPSKGMNLAMKVLSSLYPAATAAAIVGNMMQESSMNPLASNASGHMGLMQWDKSRQASFMKQFGYSMGSTEVPTSKQFDDQITFAVQELKTTHKRAADKMAEAQSLMGKVSAFMGLDEVVNDSSFARRLLYATQLITAIGKGNVSTTTVTNDTHIGSINVHTPSTDPAAHADAVRKGVATHPLVAPIAQGTVALATRGMSG